MARNGYIKFDIGVRDHFGSTNAAIAFSRLLYWSKKNPDGFYKFKQACKHPLYKRGDSWSEELNMTKEIMNPVFKRLVTYHKSKNEYRKAADKFDGKFFCSYTERNTNKTYYFMDKEAVDHFLAKLAPLPKAPVKSSEVVAAPVTPIIMPSSESRAASMTPPVARTHPDLPCIQTITSLSGDAPSSVEPQREEDKLISKKMVDTWNSHMQDSVIWYPSYAAKLSKVLSDFFKGCLETFKQYCLSVASADFLTGKAKNSRFKAFLFWAIKPAVIESILAGAYGAKNFFMISTPEEKEIKTEIAHINNQLKVVDHKIASSEDEIKAGRKKPINDLKDGLSAEEINNLREESDREYRVKNPPHPSDNVAILKFAMNAYFDGRDGFLNRKLKERLGFSENIVTPQELLDAKASLEAERDKKVKELSELHAKKRNLRGMILSPL
jgi:hypothetical protein